MSNIISFYLCMEPCVWKFMPGLCFPRIQSKNLVLLFVPARRSNMEIEAVLFFCAACVPNNRASLELKWRTFQHTIQTKESFLVASVVGRRLR